MPKGFTIAEEGHDVLALAPVDINGGVNSAVWSMTQWGHASILVALGVTGGATTVTVEECDDFVPSSVTAIAFSYYKEETAGGDVLSAKQAATTSGFVASTNDGVFYRLEIDAAQLSDGFPNLRVVLSDPSGATFGAVIATLSSGRYAGVSSPTVIA